MEATKRLYRSTKDKIIGGLCGGIAEYFSIDPVIVRLIVVILFLLSGWGFLAYIIGWIIVPKSPFNWSVPKTEESKEEPKTEEPKTEEPKTE
jgi:phage shock protein PspC (stress-responsive transcriptional regulator)